MHYLGMQEPTLLYPGDFVLVDHYTEHYFTTDNGEVFNLMFRPELLNISLKECPTISEFLKNPRFNLSKEMADAFPVDRILYDSSTQVITLMRLIHEQLDIKSELSRTIIQHSLITLLLYINQLHYMQETKTIRLSDRIIAVIKEYYSASNPLGIAAGHLNYSASFLSTVFQKECGISFKEYLQNFRIELAKNYLEDTTVTISDIAYAVGYSDTKFFRSIFKKHIGMTPSEYRQKHADSNPLFSQHLL